MLNFYRLRQDYLSFKGTERLDLINRLSTNEVNSLEKFGTCKTILTSDKGRIIDLLTLYNLGDIIFVSCSFNNAEPVIAHLDKYTIMDDFTVKNLSGTHETILFTGNSSAEFVSRFAGIDTGSADDKTFFVTKDHDAIICVNDSLMGGVLFIYSTDDKEYWENKISGVTYTGFQNPLEKSGKDFETERIELGIPGFGKELSEQFNPLECGLNKYVNFTKGCYIGQEVIARLDAYDKISKHMVGLKIEGSYSEINEQLKITTGGKECGILTSTADSGKYGFIGLGFIKTIFLDENKDYFIKYNNGQLKCRIAKLPFSDLN